MATRQMATRLMFVHDFMEIDVIAITTKDKNQALLKLVKLFDWELIEDCFIKEYKDELDSRLVDNIRAARALGHGRL